MPSRPSAYQKNYSRTNQHEELPREWLDSEEGSLDGSQCITVSDKDKLWNVEVGSRLLYNACTQLGYRPRTPAQLSTQDQSYHRTSGAEPFNEHRQSLLQF